MRRVIATFVAAFLASQHADAATIERGPYLQSPTANSVILVWRLDAPAATELDYGVTLDYGTTRSQAEQLTHAVTLDGLQPHTRYYYRIRAGADTLTAGPQDWFETARERGPLRALIFGDSGKGNGAQDSLATLLVQEDVDLILHTGDIVYPGGEDANFKPHFFDPYAELLRSTPIYPAIGNHDVFSDAGAWLDNFYLPIGSYNNSERVYSFDWGDAHIVVLDSNAMGSSQGDWMEEDLAASEKPWKFVMMHHPAYSCGQYGSNYSVRGAFVAQAERQGVDVVFCGHDHDYQRSLPILGGEAFGQATNPDYVDPVGPIYVVTGGGADVRPTSTDCWFTAVAQSRTHYTRMSIVYNTLTIEAVDVLGEVFDRMTITKSHLQPNRAPVISLTALPTMGDVPLPVSFHAGAADPEGEPLQALWDFGDGEVDSTLSPMHTYTVAGTYWARVHVADPFGGSVEDSVQIEVHEPPPPNLPPEVSATIGPQQGVAPHFVVFQAVGTDPDGDTLTYEWLLGDSTTIAAAGGTHVYSEPGWYVVSVTVTDPLGAQATTGHLVIVGTPEPTNEPPSVTMAATPSSGECPLEVTFSTDASDPEGGPLHYLWSFGDGAVDTVAAPTHVFVSPGQFTPRVIVTDEHGASAIAEAQIQVSAPAEPPVVAPVLARINFQPAGAVPDGYTQDDGRQFTDAAGFGWVGRSVRTERRNYYPDDRLDTYAYVSNPDSVVWDMVLANGDYTIEFAVGSPQFSGDHRVVVQGVLVVNDVHTKKGEFVTVADLPVRVTDGRMHVQLGGVIGSAFKSKLCYVHVASVGVQEPPTDVPHFPTPTVLRLIPNPANPSVRIDFSLARPEDVRLDIFDVRGRHICHLFAGHLLAGDQAVVWNGLDERGQGVQSGVYFVHVRIGAERHVSKLTITR